MEHLYLVNLCVVGIDTANARSQILLTIADSCRGVILCTHLVDSLRKLLFGNLPIALVQTNVTSFFEALIRLRGPVAEDHHGAIQEAVALLHIGIDQTITGTQQYNEHEDTPCHRKARECRAQFVATSCLPNLIQ